MGKGLLILVTCAVLGCGGEEPPSCQQAIGTYYDAGCTFFDPSTNPPTITTEGQALAACQGINVDIPERCRSRFDDWKLCLSGISSDAQCEDCSQETDALFACD